jgi:hypothetical protein
MPGLRSAEEARRARGGGGEDPVEEGPLSAGPGWKLGVAIVSSGIALHADRIWRLDKTLFRLQDLFGICSRGAA